MFGCVTKFIAFKIAFKKLLAYRRPLVVKDEGKRSSHYNFLHLNTRAN